MARVKFRARAYSLLEMVVASLIFATVAVALTGVFAFHYHAIGSTRLFLIGQYLAHARMDEVIAAGALRAPVLDDGGTPPPPVAVEFMIRDQVIKTKYTVATTVTPAAFPAGHLDCSVTVSWPEPNRTRNVRYCASISPQS